MRTPAGYFAVFLTLFLWIHAAGPGVSLAGRGPAGELLGQMEELRIEGRFDEALAVARQRVAALREMSLAAWWVQDAEQTVATLEAVVRLPAAAQSEMAEAYRLTREINQLRDQNALAEGVELSEKRLEIRRRHLGDRSLEVAEDKFRLAAFLGYNPRARSLAEAALQTQRELLGNEHPQVVSTLEFLAWWHSEDGKLAEAEALFREALVQNRMLHGEEHEKVAESFGWLGRLCMQQGDYARAELYTTRALALVRNIWHSKHWMVATCQNNLGIIAGSLGDHVTAESLLRESLDLRREILGDEHAHVTMSMISLGCTLMEQGKYAEAEPLLLEAARRNAERLGWEDPECLFALAELYRNRGDFAAAEPLYREILAVFDAHPEHLRPTVVAFLDGLGKLLIAKREYAEAEEIYTRATALYERFYAAEHPFIANTLARRGFCALARQDHAAAEDLLSRAATIFETARLRLGAGFKRATGDLAASPYKHLAAARLRLGDPEGAWQAAEKSLGRALADLLLTAGQRSLGPAEAARQDSLQKDLARLEQQLALLLEAGEADTSGRRTRDIETTRTELANAEAAWGTLQREIAARHPVTEGQSFALDRIQGSIAGNTALVGWLSVGVGPENLGTWGYVIRRTGPVEWVELAGRYGPGDSSSLERSAATFREALLVAASWRERILDIEEISALAADSWGCWVAPLTAHLTGIDNLVVFPSGPLLGVPVEAFRAADGMVLGDRYAVSYAPSATVYTWLQEQEAERPKRSGPTRALLVGDPCFNEEHLLAMNQESETRPSPLAGGEIEVAQLLDQTVLRSALAGNREALAALPRLPMTRREVQTVAAVLPEVTVLLGDQASEQELDRLAETGALRSFDTIHLATHALVDDRRPGRSALILSLVGLPDPLEATLAGQRVYDGLLSAREVVSQWDLDADLVVLSGCQTALGREIEGEGYLGLVNAFLQAGGRNLLVSLWRVEDQATSLLMERFYENLIGVPGENRGDQPGEPMPMARALTEAKSWLRNHTDPAGRRPFRHPAYWSGFVLIGAPEPAAER